MELAPHLEPLVAPLDSARRRVMAASLRIGPLAWVMVRRDRRVCLQAAAGITTSLALCAFFPAALFCVTPSLFGVAHVVGDVRHLVLRRSLPRIVPTLVAMFVAGMIALRVDEAIGSREPAVFLEVALGWGWAASMIALATALHRRWLRGAIALALMAPFAVAALSSPSMARLVFAHAHNLIGVIVWIALFRRLSWHALVPLTVLALALVTILSGLTVPLARSVAGLGAFGLSLENASSWLAPGLPPTIAVPVAISYVFLQSVHYGVWLGWLPQDDVQAQGTTSFAMTARNLARELGSVGLAIAIGGAALMIVLSCVDLHTTRNTYLSLATFHGYLEVAMLGYFAVAGRPQLATNGAVRTSSNA